MPTAASYVPGDVITNSLVTRMCCPPACRIRLAAHSIYQWWSERMPSSHTAPAKCLVSLPKRGFLSFRINT